VGIRAAPRIDPRLRQFIAGSPFFASPADVTRATGELAWSLGLVRPSYQQVRELMGGAIRPTPVGSAAQTSPGRVVLLRNGNRVMGRLYEYPERSSYTGTRGTNVGASNSLLQALGRVTVHVDRELRFVSTSTGTAARSWHVIRRESAADLARDFKDALVENRVLTYASAVAYRSLVATVPLILLGLALLGTFGLQSTWTNSIRPAIDPHVEKPVARAIDFTVQQILSGRSTGLLVFAVLWLLWNFAFAVLTIMEALNQIHDVRERRTIVQKIGTAVALGAAVGFLLVLAVLVMSAAPLINGSVLHLVFGIGRWFAAPALLVATVTILFRYAPAERPETEWASAGSTLVVLVWLVATAVFVWWISIANYKSATGNLTVLVTISAYVFVTSAIFLLGAQLDELLRKRARRA
jgi:membrane protein